MNVIRFNWKLIRKIVLFLIGIYMIKLLTVELYYLNKKSTLIYDEKASQFWIRNLNYSLFAIRNEHEKYEYFKIKLNCINFYYYKLLPNLWPNLIESIIGLRRKELLFNCLNIKLAWNLFSFNFQYDEKVYEFENRYYDLNAVINLIASYGLHVVITLNVVNSNSYLDFGGLPYWVSLGTDERSEKFFETLNVEYEIYLDSLLKYLTEKEFFYHQNGPIVGLIADREINLFEEKSNLLQNLMEKYSLYDILLKEYYLDDAYSTIGMIVPYNFYNYTQFSHLKFNSNGFQQEHNYWGDVNSRETYSNGQKFNNILLNLLENKTKNYSLILNNYHCFHNCHTLNGASLVKNTQHQYHYKPFSNEIELSNCFISSTLEPTANYHYLNRSEIYENKPKKIFSHKVDLEYSLNLKKFIEEFDLLNPSVPLNKSNHQINFESLINVDYLKLSSNSAISNSDATFFYYTAKVMLPKGTLVNIRKTLFADYLIFKCDDRQLLSLNRMNYNQHYFYDKTDFLDKNQITFLLNEDCNEFNVIVENMGRLNGDNLSVKKIFLEKKGLFSKNSITLSHLETFIENWTFYPINLENLITKSRLGFNSKWELLNVYDKTFNSLNYPTFFYTRIDLKANRELASLLENEATYLYLSMVNWVKGFVVFNGYSLGRYWSTMGPLCTLKLPKFIINFQGINELIIMEMHNVSQFYVKITNAHEYSPCLTNSPS